jgi:hypothetical protein
LTLPRIKREKKMEIKEKIILGVLAVMVLLGGTKAVSAKNIEQDAVVNKVDSIMVSDPSSVSNTYNWGSGTSSITDVYKVKFTLTNTAYVKVSVNSTVCYSNLSNLGALTNARVTTSGGKQVGKSVGSNSDYIDAYENYAGYFILEKGTYYVEYDGKKDSYYGKDSSGKVTTTIEAQYLNRTGNVNGISSKSMIPLTNGKVSYGYISNLYGEQYFEITLNKKSKVNFNMSIADTPSCFNPEVTYDLVSLGGVSYQSKINQQPSSSKGYDDYVLGTQRYSSHSYGPYPSSGSTGYVTVPAGTYYLKIAVSSDKENNVGEIKVTPNVIEENSNKNTNPVVKTLNPPKLKSYKKNTKKITGMATKGSVVKIKIGKKTYTVKVKKNGKFKVKLRKKLKKNQKIRVYAKKNGYKRSKTIVFKVK